MEIDEFRSKPSEVMSSSDNMETASVAASAPAEVINDSLDEQKDGGKGEGAQEVTSAKNEVNPQEEHCQKEEDHAHVESHLGEGESHSLKESHSENEASRLGDGKDKCGESQSDNEESLLRDDDSPQEESHSSVNESLSQKEENLLLEEEEASSQGEGHLLKETSQSPSIQSPPKNEDILHSGEDLNEHLSCQQKESHLEELNHPQDESHSHQQKGSNLEEDLSHLQDESHLYEERNLDTCLSQQEESLFDKVQSDPQKENHSHEEPSHPLEESNSRDDLPQNKSHLNEEQSHIDDKQNHLEEEPSHLEEEQSHLEEEQSHLEEEQSHLEEEQSHLEDSDKRTEEDMETNEMQQSSEDSLTRESEEAIGNHNGPLDSGATSDVEKEQEEDTEQAKDAEPDKTPDALVDSLGESMDTALVIEDDDEDNNDQRTVANTVQLSTPCLTSPAVNSVPAVTCSLTTSSNGQEKAGVDDDEIECSAESSIDITPSHHIGEDDCIVQTHHVPRSLAVVGCKITMYERKGLVFIREGKTGLCGMVYMVLKAGTNGTQQVIEKEYLCNFCQKRLKNLDALQKHMVNHIFGCSMCEKKFLTHIELVRHTYENHPSCARVLAGFAYLDPKHREENLKDTEAFDSKMRAVDVAPSVLAPLPKPSLNVRVIRPGTTSSGPTLLTSRGRGISATGSAQTATTALVYACDLCSFKTKDSAVMLRHTKSHPAGEMINAARMTATGSNMPALYGCPKCHVKTDSAKMMVEHVEKTHAAYLRTLNQGSAAPRAPYILLSNTASTVPPGQSLLTVSSTSMTRSVPSTLVNSVPTSSMSSTYQQKVLTAAARAIGRDPNDFRAIVQHSPAAQPNQFKTTVLLQPVANSTRPGGPRTSYSIVPSTSGASGSSPVISNSSSMLRCSTPAASPAKWKCQYCPMMVGQRDVMVSHVKQAHPLEKQVILKIGPRLPDPAPTIDLTTMPDVPASAPKAPEASANSKIMLLKSNPSRTPRGRVPTLASLCVKLLNSQSRGASANQHNKAVKIQYRDHSGKKRGLMIAIANRHGKEPSDQSLARFYVETGKHFECSLCQKAINSVLIMRAHLLNKHFTRESWCCSYCEFNAKERNDLVLHVLDNHKDLKGVFPEIINARKYMLPPKGAPLPTAVNRSLRGPRSVRQNNMMHSAKSMWQCPFCTRRSIFRGELAVHVRLVHPNEPENTVFQRWSRPRLRPREVKRGQKLAVHLVRLEDMEKMPRLKGLLRQDAEIDPLMTELDIDDEEDGGTVRATYVPVEAEAAPAAKGPTKPYRCPHCALRPTAAPIRVKKHIRAMHKGMESTMIWLDADAVWKRLFFCTGTDCHYRTSDVNNFMSHIMENADHRIPELKLPAEVQQLITDCDLQGTLDLLTATAQQEQKAKAETKLNILEDKSNQNEAKVNGSEGGVTSRAKRKRSIPVNGYQEKDEDDMESELLPQTQPKRRLRQRTDHSKSNRCWLGEQINGWDMSDTPLICMQASCGRLPMGYDDMKIHMAAAHPMLPIARNPSAEGKEPSRVYLCVKPNCTFATYFMEHFQFHLSVKHNKPPVECSPSLRNLISEHRKAAEDQQAAERPTQQQPAMQQPPKQQPPKQQPPPKQPEPTSLPSIPIVVVATSEAAQLPSNVNLSRKRKFGPNVDSDDENDIDYQPYVKNSSQPKPPPAKKRSTRRSGRQPTASSDSVDSHGEASLDAPLMPSLEAEETLPPSPPQQPPMVPKLVIKSGAHRSILAPRSPRADVTPKPLPREAPAPTPPPPIEKPKSVAKKLQPAAEKPPPSPAPKLASAEKKAPSPSKKKEEKTQIGGKDLPEERYLCRVDCGSAFKTMQDIQKHQYNTDHGRIGPEGYVCRDLVCRMQRKKQYVFYCSNFFCTFMCKKLTELSKHHANCKHAGSKPPAQAPPESQPPPASSPPSTDKAKDAEDANKMYQCSYCSYMTTGQGVIRQHVVAVHQDSSDSYTAIDLSGDGNLQVRPESPKIIPPKVRETSKEAVKESVKETSKEIVKETAPSAPVKDKTSEIAKKQKADDSSDSSSDDSDDSSDDDDDDDDDDDSSDDSDSSDDDDDDDDSDDSDDSSDDDAKSEKSKSALTPAQPSS